MDRTVKIPSKDEFVKLADTIIREANVKDKTIIKSFILGFKRAYEAIELYNED